MPIRAKFICTQVAQIGYTEVIAEAIEMQAVYDPDPESENHRFWTAMPQGSIKMTIDNREAFGAFAVGKQYLVDLTPVG